MANNNRIANEALNVSQELIEISLDYIEAQRRQLRQVTSILCCALAALALHEDDLDDIEPSIEAARELITNVCEAFDSVILEREIQSNDVRQAA